VTDPGNLFVEQYGPGGPAQRVGHHRRDAGQPRAAGGGAGADGVERHRRGKRKVSGVSSDRVAMIIAVLEKRAEMRLAADDVFVNVAGGVKVAEPAIDLAIALAIASAHMNRPLSAGTFAVGELGLGGEVRSVPQLEVRLREAARLGCSARDRAHTWVATVPKLGGMALHEVRAAVAGAGMAAHHLLENLPRTARRPFSTPTNLQVEYFTSRPIPIASTAAAGRCS
jgi:hypothetical protein